MIDGMIRNSLGLWLDAWVLLWLFPISLPLGEMALG